MSDENTCNVQAYDLAVRSNGAAVNFCNAFATDQFPSYSLSNSLSILSLTA